MNILKSKKKLFKTHNNMLKILRKNLTILKKPCKKRTQTLQL